MLNINPADEYSLFEQPVTVSVLTVINKAVQLVPIDPARVMLVISSSGSPSVTLAPIGQSAAGVGINLVTGPASFIVFYFRDHGPLCQAGWEVFDTAGGKTITAITASLRRPPEMYGYKGVFLERSAMPEVPPPFAYRSRRPMRPAVKIPAAVLAALGRSCPRLLGEG